MKKRYMFRERRYGFNWWLKWTATVVTLAGAVMTSQALDPWNVYTLNLGALIYLWWSWRVREVSLMVVNAGLVLIYLVGMLFR